jgi:hypothetical protein
MNISFCLALIARCRSLLQSKSKQQDDLLALAYDLLADDQEKIARLTEELQAEKDENQELRKELECKSQRPPTQGIY